MCQFTKEGLSPDGNKFDTPSNQDVTLSHLCREQLEREAVATNFTVFGVTTRH